MEKPENKGSLAVQVILGILLLAAVALLVLLTFVDRPKGKGTLEPENISVSGETAAARKNQTPVTACNLEGISYHIVPGGISAGQAQGAEQPKTEQSGAEQAQETGESGESLLQETAEGTGNGQLQETAGGLAESQAYAAMEGNGDYILPESSSRYYSQEELEALTDEQLYYARNEIYAKLGRKFRSEELNRYFSSKSWYTPLYEPDAFDDLGDSAFNPFELANRNLIVSIENERKGGN